MDDGRSMQACLRLMYFTATIASLLACLFLVMQWTLVTGEEYVEKRFIPLPSEIDRAALNRIDSMSDPAKDFLET